MDNANEMSDAEIFHEAFKDEGGRVDLNEIPSPAAEALVYQMHRARAFLHMAANAIPDLPPVYFNFFNTPAFDACACCNGGRYLIGVSRGAMATLGFIFDRMLADPEILSYYGDSSIEDSNLPVIPALCGDYIRSVESVPSFSPPRDPVRFNIARKLGELAFDFMIAHEFSHIANGHLDHRIAIDETEFIDEVGPTALPSDSSNASEVFLTSQTKEMDADATAVRISLGGEWDKIAVRPSGFWANHYAYPGQVNQLWSYAVSSVCRIFGDARQSAGEPANEKYPSWRLRSRMIQEHTRLVPRPESLRSHPSMTTEGPEGILLTIMAACRDVEAIFSKMTGLPQVMEGFDQAWGAVGLAQMQRLKDHWQRQLRNELAPHSYHPLNTYA